ncbi:integral membrane protein [Meredithblackwellia eburnea MCA 4105]
MASLLRAYNTSLIRRPYATGSASAAFLFGAGDVLAQQAIEKKEKHDFIRTARLALYGGCIFAPTVTRWYMMLEGLKIKSKPALVAARVGLDQFVLTPVLVGVFFTSMSLMEGKGIEEAKRRISTSWAPTLVKNWGLFIPVQLANFSIVPAHLRLVLVNVVSLFWNAYLSYANSSSASAKAQIEDKAEEAGEKIKELLA